VGTAIEAGSRRRRCQGAVVVVTGRSGGVRVVGGRGARWPRRVAGAAGGRVWRGAHGGEGHTTRVGEGHTAHGEAAAHDEGRTRRVTETSERRGRRKEKAREPFISPLCRVTARWHSAKIFFNFKICFAEC
jgi:hypothetical protein